MSISKNRTRRGRRVDAKGRSIGPSRFVKLDHYVLNSPAYQSLKPAARALHVELRLRFNGSNNGRITLSIREAAGELHIAPDTASKAFKQLQETGFIKCRQKGSFNYKSRHASEWILTEENYNGENASKDFMRWVPKEKAGPKSGTDGPNIGTLATGSPHDGI